VPRLGDWGCAPRASADDLPAAEGAACRGPPLSRQRQRRAIEAFAKRAGFEIVAGLRRGREWRRSTLAYAQQPSQAEDLAAFTDARIAARKAALKLTPDQEKHWPGARAGTPRSQQGEDARRETRRAAERRGDAIHRLRDRADALSTRAAELRRIADAAQPLYQSLDEAQKSRFDVTFRNAERRRHMRGGATHREGSPEHGR
jgi:hypothetical protein